MGEQPIEMLNEMVKELQADGVTGLAFFANRTQDASINDMARDAITHLEAVKGSATDTTSITL